MDNDTNIDLQSIARKCGLFDKTDTDAFVTGDLKFHTALNSKQAVFDIGHFESEVFAPELLKEITQVGERGIIADEKSPFI